MSERAFEVGDHVRIIGNGFQQEPDAADRPTGIVRMVDTSRRRSDPYHIYYVELQGEDRLVDFEYRELERISSTDTEAGVLH